MKLTKKDEIIERIAILMLELHEEPSDSFLNARLVTYKRAGCDAAEMAFRLQRYRRGEEDALEVPGRPKFNARMQHMKNRVAATEREVKALVYGKR